MALHVAQVAVHTLLAASHMCGCRDELEQHAYNTMHAYTGVSQPLHREDLPQVGPRVQAPIAPTHRVGVFYSPLHLPVSEGGESAWNPVAGRADCCAHRLSG